MRTTLALALAMAGAGALSASTDAATTTFNGVATVHGGFGNNTSLNSSQTSGSGVLGGDLTATLARVTARGQTQLTGTADVTQGFNGNGRTENYVARLYQAQQFSPRLQVQGDVTYTDSFNPGPNYSTDARDLLPIGDILTLGTHSRQLSGDINAGYQLTSKDLFQFGGNVARTTYSTLGASAYTQYGGSFGYLRTVSASTRVGIQFSYIRVLSDRFANSGSGTIGLQLTQRINARWTFAGGVNGLLQHTDGNSFKTIGFNGSLCGDYDRYTICVLGSRQSAASGIGGLRIDTQGGARLNYKLTPRSTLDAEVTYDVSRSNGTALATQRYMDGALTYRRTITRRLSGGFTGRYQRRKIEQVGAFVGGSTNGYSATADLSYQFGRTS